MGETESQRQNREYHEGEFQTHDPVTGLPRKTPLPELVDDAVTQEDPNAPATPGNTDYDASWNKDELQAEADRRELTVKGTGENGNVLKADLVKALQKSDKGK